MREWVTIAELAELGHPALPASERGLRRLAAEAWQADPARWRIEGGAVHYHVSLLPAGARHALARTGNGTRPQSPVWAAFERLPEGLRKEAMRRHRLVVEACDAAAGSRKSVAVIRMAEAHGIAAATLRGWLRLVKGVPRADWLPALAPRHAGRTAQADCDPRAWDCIVADYLRPECPAFSACYERLRDAAATHGWAPVPSERTLRRRLEREVPRAARVMARAGREKAQRVYPAQRRTRAHFAPLEAVNADGHTFDVFVTLPGRPKPFRPVLLAVQDLYSGKIVGWRMGESECWPLVRLAFLDVLSRHGIPAHAWLDNGRAFASKWMTGGTVNRFRFKVREGEPEGLLTSVGVQVHWTTPYHGQAKPIERAFGDLCETIARHPACAGAYTGRSTQHKPDNHGSRAIPFERFEELVAAEIARHNARPGRRAAACAGRSFDATFAEAMETALVTRASAAQLRLFALASDLVRADRESGEIRLHGSRYWCEALVEHAGRQVIARFDPQDLAAGVSVCAPDGRFIAEAPLIGDARFDDLDAARAHARARGEFLRASRAALEAERRLSVADVADLLPAPAPEAPAARPAAVRLVAGASGRAAEVPEWDGAALSRVVDLMDRGVLRPRDE
ncbi:MAG: hypothetical protein CVT80_00440 [Alphaproteobacteria bacterium HGW-Alphaproteobacteria-2]|nr:MAG: hypothetical protein CVT80_00440 [Alphaproteobacteria bacterium HGW-Alphaproteobacteria-2]